MEAFRTIENGKKADEDRYTDVARHWTADVLAVKLTVNRNFTVYVQIVNVLNQKKNEESGFKSG